MSFRHRAREVAFQIIYRYDPILQTTPRTVPEGEVLRNELEQHFQHFEVSSESRAFCERLVSQTLFDIDAIDAQIELHATHWRIPRMSSVDRSILRLAACELLQFRDTPPAVVMDEAVELAKQFGTQESPPFVNGILDAIVKKNPTTSVS